MGLRVNGAVKSRTEIIMEQNAKESFKALRNTKEMKAQRAGFKRQFGFDFLDGTEATAKRFPVHEADFSWRKAHLKLVETNTSSQFPQLLRAGVQMIADQAYQQYGTTYEQFTKVINSKKDTELYAPLQGQTFPREVGRSEKYPESAVAGLDISLKNRKYGSILPVEMELYDDDQTGQMATQAGLLGEYIKQVMEVLVYFKLSGNATGGYAGYTPQASETRPSDEAAPWPYRPKTNPFIGGGFNRPASYGLLTQANLQTAITAMRNQKNLLGLKIAIKTNRLIIGTQNEFTSAILLNSSFYPSGAASAGDVGGSFSINPIKGVCDVTMSPFMFKNDGTCDGDTTAWNLTDDTKPAFIVQLREALVVEQEAPNSGKSFEEDVVRFKSRMRGNADFVDPRFYWQGNDGSVTS